MLTRACEYAIQASIYLARKPEEEYTLIREISEGLDIPHYFLGKIMQNLVKAGILLSLKGPRGGLALSKKSTEITIMDIVTTIDGPDFNTNCIMGFKKCGDGFECNTHSGWCELREQIEEMFSKGSLAQLLKDLKHLEPFLQESDH